MSPKDTIFSLPESAAAPFEFNARVAAVFDDMAVRSIPGYVATQLLTQQVAKECLPRGGSLYDIGCSTGTTLVMLADIIVAHKVQCFASDICEAMVKKTSLKVSETGIESFVTTTTQNAQSLEIKDAGLVVLHYILQFIPVQERLSILSRIYEGLRPGSALVFSEKTASIDSEEFTLLQESYWSLKRYNGYSEEEIRNKAKALEGVLVPLSPQENEKLLREAGFSRVIRPLQNFQFMTWVAYR